MGTKLYIVPILLIVGAVTSVALGMDWHTAFVLFVVGPICGFIYARVLYGLIKALS